MVLFFTALIWGLGVSLGGAVGLLVFMIAKAGLDLAFGHRATIEKRIEDSNKDSLRALERRNSLTVDTIMALKQIVEAVEKLDQRDSS